MPVDSTRDYFSLRRNFGGRAERESPPLGRYFDFDEHHSLLRA
jgi:hypothetical protein